MEICVPKPPNRPNLLYFRPIDTDLRVSDIDWQWFPQAMNSVKEIHIRPMDREEDLRTLKVWLKSIDVSGLPYKICIV